MQGKFKPNPVILIFLGVVFLFFGCGKKEDEKGPSNSHTVRADTIVVEKTRVPAMRIFPGRVRSKVQIMLASKLPGYVKDVPVHIGDEVKKGDLLVLVDDTDVKARIKTLHEMRRAAKAQLNAIEARYEYSKINYERFKRLYKEESATKDELDRARTEFLAMKNQADAIRSKIKSISAQIREAKNQLSYLKILAPFDGWVADRKVDPGTYVNPGMPLIRFDGKDVGFWFEAAIDDGLFGKVKIGKKVRIVIPAIGSTSATVVHKQESSDPSTHTFTLLADFDKMSQLKSGLFGRVYIELGFHDSLLLPENVVIKRGGITGVYVVDASNTVHWRIIRTGKRWVKAKDSFLPILKDTEGIEEENQRVSGHFVEVLSGLLPGERVISSNLLKVKEGDKVE